MKHYYIIPFLILCTSIPSKGQNNDPLIGTWKNEYGSTLSIDWHNNEGYFLGIYNSSTGATGTYNISGVSPVIPSHNADTTPRPLALCILWKPIIGAKKTPNEEWTSSMTGQLFLDKSGQWTMEVFHSLNASSPLETVEINQAGRYAETLTFNRTSTRPTTQPRSRDRIRKFRKLQPSKNTTYTPLINPLTGDWISESSHNYPEITIGDVNDEQHILAGMFSGILMKENPVSTGILGYTSPSATVGNIQSASLVFMQKDAYGSVCYAANGFLYNTNRLELTIYKARMAPPASKYTAVQIEDKAVFYRNYNQAINIEMNRNNFTLNGSSEWTANFTVGNSNGKTPPPTLKIAIDTGGDFVWINSTQCTTESCTGHGHTQFDPTSSTTFAWIDKTPHSISWGPWGTAEANSGSDLLSFSPYHTPLRYNMKLITKFDENPQFDEFLWDGGIALPANSKQMLNPTSNMLKLLVDNGQISPENVCAAFYFNPESGRGLLTIGGWDSTLVDLSSKLTFKYAPYSIPYLWCSPLSSVSIGDQKITSSGFYSFDTGSSSLKGDSTQLTKMLDYAQQTFKTTKKWPVIQFEMGVDSKGKTGILKLTGDQYVQLIQEGEKAGEKVPMLQTLSGTPNLYLQGSTMLNYIYTVFWWDAKPNTKGDYDLTAREVWLFNKKEGPQIIQKNQPPELTLTPDCKHPLQNTVYPNPVNKRLHIQYCLDEPADLTLTIHSLQGEKLYERRYHAMPQGEHTIELEEVSQETRRKQPEGAWLTLKKGKQTILKKRILFNNL